MSIFNIRVYGLLINEQQEVLVTDEYRFGREITKFPGGGLVWGEGTVDCLKREFREELGCEIEVIQHVYTTDFFQASAFHENHQLISIYYTVKNTSPFSVRISESQKELAKEEGSQIFRWADLKKIMAEDMTFPIDQKIPDLLRSIFRNPGK